MFGKKKKQEDQEIARSALDLWAFIKAVLVFVEEDPKGHAYKRCYFRDTR